MNFELTTGLVQFINLNMESTRIDPDFLFEDELEDEFDFDRYKRYLLNQSKPYLQKFVNHLKQKYKLFGIHTGEVVKIYSPSNRYTGVDELYFDLKSGFNINYIYTNFNIYLNKNYISDGGVDDFDKFLKENYSSQDGFVSFIPDNMNEFNYDVKNERLEPDNTISVILSYIIEKDDLFEEYQEDFINDVFENKGNYYQNESKVNNFTTFIKENYKK